VTAPGRYDRDVTFARVHGQFVCELCFEDTDENSEDHRWYYSTQQELRCATCDTTNRKEVK
jgi:hypothetical protein